MKKLLVLVLGILFVYSIISQIIWLTVLILPVVIYLDKQNLFKEFDESRFKKVRRTKKES
ncbi:hypothetical protein ACWOA2_05255 [Granulicatella elegans]|uniref:Uncharacterized protein n=1 Tax=Granulicatella elegans ATCC 700633 TaxID=626369 RepID=T5LT38_9LACT|nr:hypothetical protein [Granulicatella elegans]EQM96965.1 hypothetical protein HMPREF0446_01708 [Granulicatella elegans ATCC 700633]